MRPDQLQQYLEESFGDLAPPKVNELGAFYPFEHFLDIVTTDAEMAKRWQELRPLRKYLDGSLDLHLLTAEASRYYLPAYLYAMTEPDNVWCYLGSVLDTLWYEDECGNPLHNNPGLRDRWNDFAALLTNQQKRCIALFLVEVLKNTTDDPMLMSAEVDMEAGRIENMLEKYWNAWL